ncbi:MAG TPA: isochorismatase family protein [Planctomycetota bacterium]|nr:isochorismatase family protein [Planctomycetota bacterium]
MKSSSSRFPNTQRVCVAVWLVVAALAQASAEDLNLTARSRTSSPAGATPLVKEKALHWAPEKTAIVICDMWDQHWCRGATERVAAMAPRMNDAVSAARSRGVFIVHAPSSCMDAYKDTPQRRRAQEAPAAKDLPKDIASWLSRLPAEPPLPIDDSDGGCDENPQCPQGNPWRREIPAIRLDERDAVTDSGQEFWNLLGARGIDNVIVMGVHTNMCVSGRPFALRQMAKNGKNVVLVRDLTDSMYNSRRAPFVSHRRGTELVVAHIEEHICPTILSTDLMGVAAPPVVAFLIGEDEYDTKTTLPAFARAELEPRGVRAVFVHESKTSPDDFPGVEEALQSASLIFVSVRRRTPAEAQLAAVRDFLASGRPVVGIRTASHSFDKEPGAGHGAWRDFDTVVLGGKYLGHYGRQPPEGGASLVRAAAPGHPLLAGFPSSDVRFDSHLYRYRDLAKTTTVLLEGSVEGRSDVKEPVAWTNAYRGGRVFYTSLGSPSDFEQGAFRGLLVRAIFWAMEREAPELPSERKSP